MVYAAQAGGPLLTSDDLTFTEHSALSGNLTPIASQTEQLQQILSVCSSRLRSHWVSREPFINPTKYIFL